MMNAEAGRLGLASTRFTEPAGISPENTTTAMDFARFCRVYLGEHPESPSAFHSRPSFAYPLAANTPGSQPQTILQYNRNTLLERLPGVDGLKTGHITEAGYNIALSGRRDRIRLAAVILGASGEEERDRDGEALLRWGFDNFSTLRFTPDYPAEIRVWGGRESRAPIALEEDPVFTVSVRRNGGGRNLPLQRAELDPHLKAPLPARSVVGTLVLSDNMGELRRFSLVLEREVPRGNFFRVLLDNIILFFKKRFGARP
jgi:D-alanyl-D-alanine carboxypeptidase (penicillin-binding protein 5/6)